MLHLSEQCKEAPTRVWQDAKDGQELYRMIKEVIIKHYRIRSGK